MKIARFIVFILDSGLTVIDLRIEFLNDLLKNHYFNLLFLYLCFSVLLLPPEGFGQQLGQC